MILFLTGLALFCGLTFRAVFGKAKEGIDTPTGISLIEMEETKNTLIIGLFVTFAVTYHTKWFPVLGRIGIFTVTLTLLFLQVIEVSYYLRAKKSRPDGCSQCQYLECTTKSGGCFFLMIHHYVSTMAAFLGLLEVIIKPIVDCYLESKMFDVTNTMELIPPATPLTPRPSSQAVDIEHPHEILH
ncbi:hypothetical protein BG000_006002 [Podila horticola]|nr:hypothetical protein BG000_006002 [Podila horticola]